MKTVAQNIRGLLAQFGGVWITPDFSLEADAENVSDQQRHFRRAVAATIDRKLYSNAFKANEQMLTFFDELGLHAQVFNQLDEAPNIVSVDALKLPYQIVDQAKPRLKLWVLSLVR